MARASFARCRLCLSSQMWRQEEEEEEDRASSHVKWKKMAIWHTASVGRWNNKKTEKNVYNCYLDAFGL